MKFGPVGLGKQIVDRHIGILEVHIDKCNVNKQLMVYLTLQTMQLCKSAISDVPFPSRFSVMQISSFTLTL